MIAAAIELVCASGRALGRNPTLTARPHHAYEMQIGELGDPNVRFIRVIGLDGAWDRIPVVLAAKHYNAAQTFSRNFWLYVVEHALAPGRAKIHRIHDPVRVRVARFVFDHRWCVQTMPHTHWHSQQPPMHSLSSKLYSEINSRFLGSWPPAPWENPN